MSSKFEQIHKQKEIKNKHAMIIHKKGAELII